jgi:catechol 2,3-dioxygenase-like lactoylglutathione lyase family enzyme
MSGLRFDHIGVQVRELERAADVFEHMFGYRRVTEPIENTRHKVRGVFLVGEGGPPIKLISPVGPNAADRRFGVHHLAFLTEDIHADIAELRRLGARLLSRPQPGEMFDDNLIAFMHAAGTNIELVTTRNWRGRLSATEMRDGA